MAIGKNFPDLNVREGFATVWQGEQALGTYTRDLAGATSKSSVDNDHQVVYGHSRYVSGPWAPQGALPITSGDVAIAPSANCDVHITYTGVLYRQHAFDQIIFGYDATPTISGYVKVYENNTLRMQWPVTSAGPGPIQIGEKGYKQQYTNQDVKITLTTGGAGIRGYLTVGRHRLE